MKKIFCFLVFVLGSICLFAQTINVPKVNPKFGKPTKEEMEMTIYEPDTTAVAVCLYKETLIDYEFRESILKIIYTHKVRIKILKEEGISYANVTLPYFRHESNIYAGESIEALEAASYNMEDDKVVRTKMKNDQVFDERLEEFYVLKKFTIPQARVGTVLEYKYRLVSDFYYNIRVWKAQELIPVRYAEYNVIIPEYFKFNVETRGVERLMSEKKNHTLDLHINGQFITCNGIHTTFRGENLAAFKSEPLCWNMDDYCTQVSMDLSRIEFPGLPYQDISESWGKIDEMLLGSKNFGKHLHMENPLKVEMDRLNIERMESNEDKICAIFQLLKSKVRWNEQYSLWGRDESEILKEGTGSNADINFILMSMLRDANITAVPVVMSLRDRASLSQIHPDINNLSTFVVGVMKDSTFSYLDGSLCDGYLDVLPPVLMSNRARMLTGVRAFWVNLQKMGFNSVRSNVYATLSQEGKLEGTRTASYYGQYASNFKRQYREAKDSLDFVQGLENRYGIKYNSYATKGVREFSAKVSETSSFSKNTEVSADYIYVNPLLFMHMPETPFKQSERRLPVEFDYSYDYHIRVSLMIPEGYSVDELPQSVSLVTEDKHMSLKYNVVHQGQQIGIKYEFKLDEVFYSVDKYQELKKFWEIMAEVNNSMLVLKKN